MALVQVSGFGCRFSVCSRVASEVPSLTNFPKLHRLALFGFTNEVIPVLGRLPLFAPSSLVGIFVYTYSATQDDEVPESEWKAVDLALCDTKFNHLKCVEFHALNDQPLQNPHAYFRQALPTCYQRGILWYRPYRQGSCFYCDQASSFSLV